MALLASALRALSAVGQNIHVSSVYESEPQYRLDQPKFLNAALLMETEFGPRKLLRACKQIERDLGRVTGERYGPRVIDIDVLAYGALSFRTEGLSLPHERIAEREFALGPLHELDAGSRVPSLKQVLSASRSEPLCTIKLHGSF